MKQNNNDIICYCMEVTYKTVIDAIKNGAKTVEDITNMTDAGLSCGGCIVDLEEILEEFAK